jgi:hypothetical protein
VLPADKCKSPGWAVAPPTPTYTEPELPVLATPELNTTIPVFAALSDNKVRAPLVEELEPVFTDTEPPVVPDVDPDESTRLPPTPVSEEPTLTDTSPAEAPVAEPDPILIAPLRPASEVPLLKNTAPLTPAGAVPVRMYIAPEEVVLVALRI